MSGEGNWWVVLDWDVPGWFVRNGRGTWWGLSEW